MSVPVAAWDPRQIYRLAEQVTLNGQTYTCARDYNYNNAPSAVSTWWTNTTPAPPAPSGTTYIGEGTIALAAVPAPGDRTSVAVALATTAQLKASSVYLIIGAVTLTAYNSDGTPRSITWSAGDDALRVSITTPTIVGGGNVDLYTNAAIWNERGFVGVGSDYPFTLMASTSSAAPSGNLVLQVDISNASGTVSYGNLSSVQAFVYKLI